MAKVIGVGFHKTGTTSLGAALKTLGFHVCGTKIHLVKELARGNAEPALELAEQFDAFQDFPWPLLYRELDERFPNSKFILTVRDEESWLKSSLNHFGSERESLELIYGAARPKGNEPIYLDRYRRHNQDVLDYFANRPDDLLVLDMSAEDGWAPLTRFLGKEVPSSPFPHRQKAKYGLRKYASIRGVRKSIGRLRDVALGRRRMIRPPRPR